MQDDDESAKVPEPTIRQGCGCAMIILALALGGSMGEIIALVSKLVDKL